MVYKDEKSFAEVIFNGCKFLKEIVALRRWEVLQYQLSLQCKAFWGIIVGAVTSLAAMQYYGARTFVLFYLWNVVFPYFNCLLFFVPFLSGAAAAKSRIHV